MARKVCIVSEGLGGSRDEGMRNFVLSISRALAERHSVRTIALDTGVGTPGEVRTNRLLLSLALRRVLAEFAPDLTLYVPLASSTLGAFLRSWTLRRLYPGARVAMVSLQPRQHGPLARILIRWFHPDGFLSQDQRSLSEVRDALPSDTLPSGVDLSRFRPLDSEEKGRLRKSMELEASDFVVLHVGHIRRERNVAVMRAIARQPSCRPILVGSTSTEQDEALACELEASGVRVIRDHVPDIERLYQASDCYLFPVFSDHAAIEMPLSVLEAMATDLPVLSTRFGALPSHFPEGSGVWYFERVDQLPDLIERVRTSPRLSVRDRVLPFSWERVGAGLEETFGRWGWL